MVERSKEVGKLAGLQVEGGKGSLALISREGGGEETARVGAEVRQLTLYP